MGKSKKELYPNEVPKEIKIPVGAGIPIEIVAGETILEAIVVNVLGESVKLTNYAPESVRIPAHLNKKEKVAKKEPDKDTK